MTQEKAKSLGVLTLVVGMIGTNCYILFDENTKEAAVIDPGDEAERILGAVRQRELQVKYILLTHGHFDHILAAHAVQQATGAVLVVHGDDADKLKSSEIEGYKPFLRGKYEEAVPGVLAKDGEVVKLGSSELRYISTPGHTEGSCVITAGDFLFSGDTLFCKECGRCDLKGGNYSDMLRSLKRLAMLPGNFTVYPGHGEKTTLSSERIFNPYIREAMAQ